MKLEFKTCINLPATLDISSMYGASNSAGMLNYDCLPRNQHKQEDPHLMCLALCRILQQVSRLKGSSVINHWQFLITSAISPWTEAIPFSPCPPSCSQVSKRESTTVLDVEMIAQPEKSIERSEVSEVFLFTKKLRSISPNGCIFGTSRMKKH